MKISFIGGGSITWMPTFLNDLSMCKEMENGVITLYDIHGEHRGLIQRFGEKLMVEKGVNIRLEEVKTLKEALTDSQFVVSTVMIGGHDAWKDDINTILSFGIQHPKGMSVGPGGLFQGLKQIPYIVHLAKEMEKYCPDAWLLNFSNPMQTITLAVQMYSNIKCIGLCHGVTHTMSFIAKMLGMNENELTFTIGGANHCEFITSVIGNGQDQLPVLLEKIKEYKNTHPLIWEQSGEIVTSEIYHLFGAFPCNSDIHAIEFFPYYIQKNSQLEDYGLKHNYIENRIEYRNQRWEKIKQYLDHEIKREEIVDSASTEKLTDMIESITANKPLYLYANVKNNGAITNVNPDMCVEIPIVLRRDGYESCQIGKLPTAAACITNIHGAVQELTVEAAMTGSYQACLQAISLDPMCYTLSLAERTQLIDVLLADNKEWVSENFWSTIKQYGKSSVHIYETRNDMGKAAAKHAKNVILNKINSQNEVNIIFAAAPSQDEFLDALLGDKEIDWSRINAFHMDEYVGIDTENPLSLASYLRRKFKDRVVFKSVHFLNGMASDVEQECLRYEELLRKMPVDIVCLGIGDNCHLAFNDPHVASFKDQRFVKTVEIDLISKRQQLATGFETIDDIPSVAFTVTIPALMSADYVVCTVPTAQKSEAIFNALTKDISEQYPASVLRTHENVEVFLDAESAKLL